MKQIKRLSLPKSAYLLVLFCWVLPLLIAVVWFSASQEESLQTSMEETVVSAVSYAMDETARRLEAAMTDSRAVSYDGDIDALYQLYLDNGDQVALHSESSAYLQGQFGYNQSFSAAILVYWDLAEIPVLVRVRGQEFPMRSSEIAARSQEILASGESLGTDTVVVSYEGQLCLMRNLVDRQFQPYATLILPFNETYLLESGENIPWVESSTLFIEDVEVNIVGDHAPLTQYEFYHDAVNRQYTVGALQEVERKELRLEVAVTDQVFWQKQADFYVTVVLLIMLSGGLFIGNL